jgi:AraC family transcriptional activator of pobA
LYYFYIHHFQRNTGMPKNAHKATASEVPRFALYGEQDQAAFAESIHIELIETRSRLHDWHIGRHTHNGLFQVLFLSEGSVEAQIDDALHRCTGPTVMAIHPSVEHGFDFSRDAQGYVLTVDQGIVFAAGDSFAPLFADALLLDLQGEAALTERLDQLFAQLMAEFGGQRQGHTAMLQWLAQCVFMQLSRLQGERRSAEQTGRNDFALFTRFRALLEQHYKAQWRIDQYAAKLRVTPTRLNRLCLRLAQESAFDMTQRRLMLEACRQLTYLPSSVATIAYELGYQDPAYFSRAFKRFTAATPSKFRARRIG